MDGVKFEFNHKISYLYKKNDHEQRRLVNLHIIKYLGIFNDVFVNKVI